MRRYFIAGNWKMNKTQSEAVELAKGLRQALSSTTHRIMIAPPFTALAAVSKEIQGSEIALGAQNISVADSGAHTGEISAEMLKDLGVSVVIIGHSERRALYSENDTLINQKLLQALKHGLQVIFCVGETLEQRDAGQAVAVVQTQLTQGLSAVANLESVTIAYEPVWAIGTGRTASPEDAETVHAAIRSHLSTLFDDLAAQKAIIQYGGSVKGSNAKALMAQPNIDGALVGGASLTVEDFLPIAQFDA